MTAVTCPPRAAAAVRTGTIPRTGRRRPSRPSSAANTRPVAGTGRDGAGRGQDRDRDRQVQAAAAAEQAGRAQAHGDTAGRPGKPAVEDRRPDPVTHLAGAVAGHADDRETGRARG